MHTVYLSIGSNLGDKSAHIKNAVNLCEVEFGRCHLSEIYESEAWGYESINTYYNGVLMFETSLTPSEIWNKIEWIENELGRVREGDAYQDRPIDLDILLMDDLIEEGDLKIPHPRMHLRDFVLKPLLDMGDPIHPVLNKKVSELLKELDDSTILKVVEL